MKFRDLRAEEIECRVQSEKQNGLILLLYKDARCDMNILDETVGAENWQREHYECKDSLFCRVGIKCGEEWVWKADCGTESNTEAQKGEASDSFKRACFNWGIGRELYTSPFIWISASDYNIKNGKCSDKFAVDSVTIENKKIVGLTIVNANTKKVVFRLFNNENEKPSKVHIEALLSTAKTKGVTEEQILKKYGIDKLENMSMAQYTNCATGLNKMEDVVVSDIYEGVN
jgi:hypothetical protein